MPFDQDPQPDVRQLAELSALADGTLAESRRSGVEAEIAASPQLTHLLEREREVVRQLQEAQRSERAPERLRARLAAEPHARRPPPRRVVWSGGLVVAALGAALALILLLPSGVPGSPTLSQALAVASRGAVAAAPRPDPAAPRTRLAQSVQDVYFPNWEHSLGWRATGQRLDRLGSRQARTVYYALGAHQLAYTILSAPALAEPSAPVRTVRGVQLQALKIDGRQVVTWRRGGHTCVLSGPGLTLAQLERLVSWREVA